MLRTKQVLVLCLSTIIVSGMLGMATTASAALPEFLRAKVCKEIRGISGFSENVWRWTNAACSAESRTVTGNFAESPFVSDKLGESTNAVFEAIRREKIVCTSETGQGEVSGARQLSKAFLLFGSCEEPSLKVRCNTPGFRAGQIETVFLAGEIGYIPRERTVGVDVWPESRTPAEITAHEFRKVVTEIECTSVVKLVVLGGIIGQVTPTNTTIRRAPEHFTTRYELKETGGVKEPGIQALKRLTGVEGETENQLSASRNGGAFERLGLTFSGELLVAEEQEIKA
jgi:hypothetical protein